MALNYYKNKGKDGGNKLFKVVGIISPVIMEQMLNRRSNCEGERAIWAKYKYI